MATTNFFDMAMPTATPVATANLESTTSNVAATPEPAPAPKRTRTRKQNTASTPDLPIIPAVPTVTTSATAQPAAEAAPAKVSKYTAARQALKELSNNLKAAAAANGRGHIGINQLLREYYNLGSEQLHTFEEWAELGASIIKGQKAVLMWGNPITNDRGFTYCPVRYMFAGYQTEVRTAA